jgi:ATP/maltotriose-dependent transcriptional regulator MalT
MQMAEPTQFHQLNSKLDDIKDLVTRLELKLEERDGIIRERIHAEITAVRNEFATYKAAVAEKITANTVKTGAIFTLLMSLLAALIAKLMQ